MLTVDEARTIAGAWRERFAESEAFVTSWSRYMEHYKHNRSPESLEAWLRADAEQDEVRAVGLAREPLLPVPQDLPEFVDDCSACRGKRWIGRDLPIGHAEFGKLLRCPACGGKPTHQSARIDAEIEQTQCFKCGQFEDQPAGDNCGNPRWHWPTWSAPAQSPVPGWSQVGEHLR